jgi:hypothetical protein
MSDYDDIEYAADQAMDAVYDLTNSYEGLDQTWRFLCRCLNNEYKEISSSRR